MARLLKTSCGSLGELTHIIQKNKNPIISEEVEKIFPMIGSGMAMGGDFEHIIEYKKHPEKRAELLNQRKVWFVVPFFHKHIPNLVEKVVKPIYSPQRDVRRLRNALHRLESELKKTRQYFRLSRQLEGEKNFANEDIEIALEEFKRRIPGKFKNLPRILFPQSITIDKIDETIDRMHGLKVTLKPGPRRGRQPKPFNILIFHIVNEFIYFVYKRDAQGKRVKIPHPRIAGQYKTRKNWQLIIAALLWIHINCHEIPEMKKFIEIHKNEPAGFALDKLKSRLKKRYQNFTRSGKGVKKFGRDFFRFEEKFLDVHYPYYDSDKRTIKSGLL